MMCYYKLTNKPTPIEPTAEPREHIEVINEDIKSIQEAM